jgi:hypothetical protein
VGGHRYTVARSCLAHMLAHREEALSTIATHVAGDPPATMDDLDDVGGGADSTAWRASSYGTE